MKRYLLVISGLAFFGLSQDMNAMGWFGTKKETTATKSEEAIAPHYGGRHRLAQHGGRHRLTPQERVARGEEAVSENAAILAALKGSGFAAKNPAAFQRAQRALQRSETRLKNVKSGKVSRRRSRMKKAVSEKAEQHRRSKKSSRKSARMTARAEKA